MGCGNPIQSLGNSVSNIPIIGNVTDAVDKLAFQTGGFTGLGGKYGIPQLWGSNGIVGSTDLDTFKDYTHALGLAAATYGAGSALGGAMGAGGAAGEAGTAGAGMSDIAGAGSVSAGLDTGAAAYPALYGETVGAGGTDLSTILADMQSNAAYNGAVGAGLAGTVGGAGLDAAAGGNQTMAPLDSYTLGGSPGATEAAGGAGGGADAAAKSGGFLSNLIGYGNKALPYTMLAGAGLNALGNYIGANQANDNLANFRQDASWTPDRIGNLTKGIDASVLGIYAKNAAEDKKTIAGNLASGGRGGGSSESARRTLDIATKNAEATAKNNALLQAGVYTPPALLTGPAAYNNVSPWAASATGASGMLGNMGNAMLSSDMLKKLLGSMNS